MPHSATQIALATELDRRMYKAMACATGAGVFASVGVGALTGFGQAPGLAMIFCICATAVLDHKREKTKQQGYIPTGFSLKRVQSNSTLQAGM